MNRDKRARVLVTGATGFVAGRCISDLLAHGYDVRGTVRNLEKADLAHPRPAIDAAAGAFELVVVHPGAIIGPPQQVKRESGADIVRRMLAGEMPAVPPLHRRPLPTWIVRAAARFNGEAKLAVDLLDIQHDVTVEKAVRELGWTPRALRRSVLDTAETLISAGIVRPGKPVSAGNPRPQCR
jgi:hypothetical protein